MGLFANGDRPSVHTLVRREAVIHLEDGETSIRGFLLNFFDEPAAVLLTKAVLLQPGQQPSELAGEQLIFETQIKFVQITGGI